MRNKDRGAKTVLEDVVPNEQTQEALLKVLALGQREVETGQVKPVADVIARLRSRSDES